MSGTKIILGIFTGAVFIGVTMAVVGYFATVNSASSSLIGAERDWWPVTVTTNFVFGLVLGAVSGAMIAGFSMSIPKAVAFGGLLNLLIVAIFYVITEGYVSDSIKYSLYSLIPIGIINGILVSFFTTPSRSLE